MTKNHKRNRLFLSVNFLLGMCKVVYPFFGHTAFASPGGKYPYLHPPPGSIPRHLSQLAIIQQDSMDYAFVEAPLKFVGPYPCITLKFPDLATASQRQRNISGVELDFVLDTAANTNTIQEAVPLELKLSKIGSALPGFGPAGFLPGADTYLLGDCQIAHCNQQGIDPFIFMTNLSASSLPSASPIAAAGLLGTAFLNCFEGGVEFIWPTSVTLGGQSIAEDISCHVPAVRFHKKTRSCSLEGLHPIPITPLNVSYLPTIQLHLNGVPLKVLLDTGSPITIINTEAANIANVKTKIQKDDIIINASSNPFSTFLQSLQKNSNKARAVASQDILLVAGLGKTLELVKTQYPVSIGAISSFNNSIGVHLAEAHVYVGDLPGLAALGDMDPLSPPMAILGMDVIKQKKRFIYRAKEVYFD
jgi:hypothetical protein